MPIVRPTTVINIFTMLEAKARAEAEDRFINIMRPGKWGNPFKLTRGGSREDVITAFKGWIIGQPLMAELPELRGKVLGCCCAPKLCHGNVLIWLADELYDELCKQCRGPRSPNWPWPQGFCSVECERAFYRALGD